MEVVHMSLFNEQSGEEEEKVIKASEVIRHMTKPRELKLSLPKDIAGEYNTLANRVLSMSFNFKNGLSEEFYKKEGYFDYNKLTPTIEHFHAIVYYRLVTYNLIISMYKYIKQYRRVVFDIDFELTPLFFSADEVIRFMVYTLRTRNFNAVKSIRKNGYLIYVDNFNSSPKGITGAVMSAEYVKDVMFSSIDLDNLPMVQINAYDITKKITRAVFQTAYQQALNNQPTAKVFISDLVNVCNMINDTEHDEMPLLRLEQLNKACISLFEAVLDFCGISSIDIAKGNLDYMNYPNRCKDLCKVCIEQGLDFERYLDICDFFGRLILFTDNYQEYPKEFDEDVINKLVIKVHRDVADTYTDINKMFIKNGMINICSPVMRINE